MEFFLDNKVAIFTAQVCLDDEFGCELNCSTMTDHTQEHKFVIAMNQVSYHSTLIEHHC